jgi:hypothetical protein
LGILAFDIDGEKAHKHFDKIIDSLGDPQIADAIRSTMQTRTGGPYGRHIILKVNPLDFVGNGNTIKTTTLWTGNSGHSEVKLKGEGGCIIAPPDSSNDADGEPGEGAISVKNRAENVNNSVMIYNSYYADHPFIV